VFLLSPATYTLLDLDRTNGIAERFAIPEDKGFTG
jgi:hypothetical protein